MSYLAQLVLNWYSYRLLMQTRIRVLIGGDSHPCELGPYCLRCCVALAKGSLDDDYDTPLPDDVLLIARDAIANHDKGVAHSRSSALATIKLAQRDYSFVTRVLAGLF